jgi:DNA-binding PadR family transcriptional regulator
VSSARILILGVLLRRQPIHGYDVRRELENWNAEEWANIAYGSIYFALSKMAEEGLVEAVNETDQAGKRAGRTEYRITEKGRAEFDRLLRLYWWERKPVIDPFQVAVTFMDKLPRDELIAALKYRVNLLRSFIPAFTYGMEAKHNIPNIPAHIIEQLRLSIAHTETELRWTEELLAKVERGELP